MRHSKPMFFGMLQYIRQRLPGPGAMAWAQNSQYLQKQTPIGAGVAVYRQILSYPGGFTPNRVTMKPPISGVSVGQIVEGALSSPSEMSG